MKNKEKIIVANWKSNKTWDDAETFFNEFGTLSNHCDTPNKVIICPPFIYLDTSGLIGEFDGFLLGAQNVSQYNFGAYTGEVSAKMLADYVEYVLVGHSERRGHFHETDEVINEKVKRCVENNITPIICIGETLQQRESGETFSILRHQLQTASKDVSEDKIIIAYEPVWAIGTGKVPTAKEIGETHEYIRRFVGSKIPIIYGGSVTDENSGEIMAIPNVDGVLVGGASLCPKKFARIVQSHIISL